MRTIPILCCVAIAVILAFARASSWADDGDEPDFDEGIESITGDPITPQPGSEQRRKDPFSLYDTGAPDAVWPYETLNAEEKLVVDRGRTDTQPEVNAAFALVSAGIAEKAKAHAATIQLGLQTSPGEIGVVP